MRLPERGEGQTRIGVAIPMPAPYAEMLSDARRRSGDGFADLIPPHVTILGPTVVDQGAMAAVVEHLAAVTSSAQAFTMILRGTGTFRPVSEVVFVQVAQGIAECEQLETAVRTGVLAQELRFNYHPHVTIAHDVEPEALDRAFEECAGFEATFDVTGVDLFEHGDDGVWRTVETFPLGG